MIGSAWNTERNDIVFITVIIMIFSHYLLGMFLTNYHSWYKNLLSVIGVFIFNSLLMIINNQLQNEYQSVLDYLVIVYKLPFLYILGWDGINVPVLTSIIPALLLWLGLESKTILLKVNIRP
ncbi:hypothetical protein [Piscibacillus salipiscarius]